MNRLKDTLEKLTEGDLTQRSSINSSDEIGYLAHSVNELVNYWETSQRKWGNLNQDLEQRVSSRTTELEDEINERKKAEDELRLFTARLERSNRELEDFAFVASHDLQEPLRKVQAFGDRLKAVCADELSEKGLTYLERMQSAAGRMQTLIKDLLTFSRVSSKAQPFVVLDLNKIAREVLSDMEVSIERQGGRVELSELQEIEADPLQMRQLLQNLIGNGLKFHKENEPPVVKVHSEIIRERRGGHGQGKNLCHLVVEDNGIGFDEKYCDRIFTVFQRLHGRSEYEGTGLGLAVCRKIVERHSGTITAKSVPGEGSKFLITMPLKQNNEETDKIDIVQNANQDDSAENLDEPQKIQGDGMETSFMVPCP
ncbi:MAG: HAMP domain-containing protein [candidate division Zixibacteria bacterium]|nr:HAMP domain-containing protein [candidate division Zixibacteria bacterium]